MIAGEDLHKVQIESVWWQFCDTKFRFPMRV